HLKKGKQVLNGAEAEGLLRYRKGYATGDLGRIDMQQAFIKEAVRQKLRPKYILKAIPVAKEITESIETNMSVMHMLKYAWKLRSSDKLKLNTHVLPGAPKTIGGASYYICDEKATQRLVRNEFGYEDGKDISQKSSSISEKVID
ncbi:MAG: LCP family protein, partial [Oscillospiraceae bacterium]|nr:LCP family protein [Oscillospiraceae bacterium]